MANAIVRRLSQGVLPRIFSCTAYVSRAVSAYVTVRPRRLFISAFFGLCRCSIEWPRASLAALFVVSVLAAAGAFFIRINVDGGNLIPTGEQIREDTLSREFQLGDPIIIYIDAARANGIFDSSLLTFVSKLSIALSKIDNLPPRSVMSLATEAGTRVYPGSLQFRPLLDPIPKNPTEMNVLRQDLRKIGILDGFLVTGDRSGTAIVVRMPARLDRRGTSTELSTRSKIFHAIEATISSLGPTSRKANGSTGAKFQISVVGAPIAELELGSNILSDLRTLLPMSLVVMTAITWIAFRRVAAATIVVLKIGASLLFTIGIMGWLGVPIQLTTALMPVILTSTCISDEVFILMRYQAESKWPASRSAVFDDKRTALITMKEMVAPATITSAMMTIGFLSFASSPIAPVRNFGLFTALGLSYCWIWSMLATPALMSSLGTKWLGRPRRNVGRSTALIRTTDVIALFCMRHATVVSVCIVMIVCASFFGISRLTVQDSWLDGFAKTSHFRSETEHVDAALNGTHLLTVFLEWPSMAGLWPVVGTRSGPLLAPKVLARIDEFEEAARTIPTVGGVLGPATAIRAAHYLFGAGMQGTRTVPNNPFSVSDVLDSFDIAQGPERRRQVFSDDMHRGAVSVMVKGANFRSTKKIMQDVTALYSKLIAPLGAKIEFGGDLAQSQKMIPLIVSTQLYSMVFTSLGILVVVVLLTGSWFIATLALVPSIVSLTTLFGVLGYSDIPLGVATSMICAMSLGIGSDYAVYLLARTCCEGAPGAGLPSSELSRWRPTWKVDVARRAVAESASPVLTISAAVVLGFGLLGLSANPVNARLGLSVSLTLCFCTFLTLFCVPAMATLIGEFLHRMKD